MEGHPLKLLRHVASVHFRPYRLGRSLPPLHLGVQSVASSHHMMHIRHQSRRRRAPHLKSCARATSLSSERRCHPPNAMSFLSRRLVRSMCTQLEATSDASLQSMRRQLHSLHASSKGYVTANICACAYACACACLHVHVRQACTCACASSMHMRMRIKHAHAHAHRMLEYSVPCTL